MAVLLSAADIETAVASGDIVITPFDRNLLKPASYVLTLGRTFATAPIGGVVEVGVAGAGSPALQYEDVDVWDLSPGDFVLGCTRESVGVGPALAGWLSNLSHHGRVGLQVHAGSQLVSPGFGTSHPTPLTLELTNQSGHVLRLRVGTPIVHLGLVRVSEGEWLADLPLARSAYEGARAPSAPRFEQEWPDSDMSELAAKK